MLVLAVVVVVRLVVHGIDVVVDPGDVTEMVVLAAVVVVVVVVLVGVVEATHCPNQREAGKS